MSCPSCQCFECRRLRKLEREGYRNGTPIDWNQVLVRIEEWFDRHPAFGVTVDKEAS